MSGGKKMGLGRVPWACIPARPLLRPQFPSCKRRIITPILQGYRGIASDNLCRVPGTEPVTEWKCYFSPTLLPVVPITVFRLSAGKKLFKIGIPILAFSSSPGLPM